MRPLRLTLEGFKSYRHPQTFEFDSRGLFGIVGPTGSGKSSILEGLIFGLFGRTPNARSETKKLINSQEEQAHIGLCFEADDVDWEVTRVIRRKGTSQTVLRRLDGVGDPVTGDRAATERIEEIIGLDFDSFCSSVSLPQGDFDRFLRATPTERSRILKGIFRLERVDQLREAAKRNWQRIEGEAGVLNATLDGFPERPELLLEQTEADLAGAIQLLEMVREEMPKVVQAELAMQISAQDIARVGGDRERTLQALRSLPPEESLRDLSERVGQAETGLSAACRELEAANRELANAQKYELETVERTGGEAWMAKVEGGLASQERLRISLSDAVQETARREEAVAAAAAARLPEAESALHAVEIEVEEARARREELQQRHAAHLLRRDLAPGEPCPVCEQTVASLPGSPDLPALSAADAAVRRAEDSLRTARKARESAKEEHALATERLRSAAETTRRLQEELAETTALLAKLAGGMDDLPAELACRREALAGARSALARARDARERADAGERAARQRYDGLAAQSAGASKLLSHVSGILGIGAGAAEDEGLWETAKRVLEAGAARVEALRAQQSRLEADARTAVQMVEGFRNRFGARPDDQASDVQARVKADVTRLELKIEDLQAGIEKRREIEVQLAALKERRTRFDRLIADFTDSKFTAFLLDEQRRLLSRLGSEKFLELTGHYTFDEEGNFQVFDRRTGMTRSPDTLSGGETFLASLSLALALSEAVALEGGRLGCFFLDEGFGSLDQESLDLALEGIGLLDDGRRLIGLISHVAGVQAVLGDLIVLERLADGSTEVVQREGPIAYASLLV